jgi:pimeloyl-ACP methyl ester carboxylesterase
VSIRTILIGLALAGFAGAVQGAESAAPLPAKLLPSACRDAAEAAKDHRRCYQLDVPEDPGRLDGRHIQLDVTVVAAAKPGPQKLAIFFLAGGPGERSTDGAGPFPELVPDHDIVRVDLRGTGTTPDLGCRAPTDDAHLQPILTEEWPADSLTACLKALEGKADVRLYTTANGAEDLDLARRALGYDRIDLIGVSYGTQLAQAYIRLHGDHVRTALLGSVVSPDSLVPEGFARHAEMSILAILDHCLDNPDCARAFPDVRTEFDVVKRRFAQGGLKLSDPANPKGPPLTVSAGVAAATLRAEAYSPESAVLIPMQIHALAHGDDAAFLKEVLDYRRSIEAGIAEGVYLSINCAEALPRDDLQALRKDADGTLYGSFRIDGLVKACAIWPKTQDPRPDLHTLAPWPGPVLAVSGELDPVTPPVYVERVMTQFPNGRLLRLPNQGHGMTREAGKCLLGLAGTFIKAGSAEGLDFRCAERLALPKFVLAPAKQP